MKRIPYLSASKTIPFGAKHSCKAYIVRLQLHDKATTVCWWTKQKYNFSQKLHENGV